MRKRQTFLLTILSSETEDESLCGRLKVISSGKSYTFTSQDELHAIILGELNDEFHQTLNACVLDNRLSQEALSSS